MAIDSFDRFNSDNDFSFCEEESQLKNIKELDLGYEYVIKIIDLLKEIENIEIKTEKARERLDFWITTIKEDFKELIRAISNYNISIKNSNKKNRDNFETQEDETRRSVSHDSLMYIIEKTIRDIRFNFDSDYDLKGKNKVFLEKYIQKLEKEQKMPDFLTSNDIEKINFKKNLFLPDNFNDAPMPSFKFLSSHRKSITVWAEEIYHSNLLKDINCS